MGIGVGRSVGDFVGLIDGEEESKIWCKETFVRHLFY
jgi:hypothetical protein